MMFYGAANRDEDVFADPDRFDVGRDPNPHLAFGGGGPHLCLGMHVARFEIGAMLRELLTRLPDLEPGRRAASAWRRTSSPACTDAGALHPGRASRVTPASGRGAS